MPRKNFSQAASKEYHEQARLLSDKDFIRSNCRVIRTERPPSAGQDDETQGQLNVDREKIKRESATKVHEGNRQEAVDKDKKKK